MDAYGNISINTTKKGATMKYQPKTKAGLQKLVKNEAVYLGDIDTSLITDMSKIFKESKREDFSGIELWDVGQVTDMRGTFANTESFNQPLEKWDVSQVTDMGFMFGGAKSFNQPLAKWNVRNVWNMEAMFAGAKVFNQPLLWWDVSKVKNMNSMFCDAEAFNQPLFLWDVRKVENMEKMFAGAESFKQKVENLENRAQEIHNDKNIIYG